MKPLNQIIEELMKCIELDFITAQQAKASTETTNGLMNTRLTPLPDAKSGLLQKYQGSYKTHIVQK